MDFWIDQKSTRRMYIGNVDKEETSKLQMKETRAMKRQKREKTVADMATRGEDSHCEYATSACAPAHDGSSDDESSMSGEFLMTDESDSDEGETVQTVLSFKCNVKRPK